MKKKKTVWMLAHERERQRYIDEIKPMFNDIVISCATDLFRLVGFHDGEDDYYYICRDWRGRKHLVSCCIPVESLRKLHTYEFIEGMFNRNGCPRQKKMLVTRDKNSPK